MEIGSLSAAQSGFRTGGMGGMRRPHGDPEQMAEELSAKIMERKDGDGDGLLSAQEFDIDSEKFANLDKNGDNLLSQDELTDGVASKMDEMRSRFQAGDFDGISLPGMEDMGTMADMMGRMDQEAMQRMRSMSGGSRSQAMASQAYAMMQEAMYGSDAQETSANTDQMLLDALNVAV